MSWKVIAILAGIGVLLIAANIALRLGPSVSSGIETHQTVVKARLAQFRQAAAAVDAHPLLKTDEVGEPAKPLVFCGDQSKSCRPNAAVVYAEDLREPGMVPPLYARIPGELVSTCASIIEHRTNPWHTRYASTPSPLDGEDVAVALGRCAALEHLIVLRTVTLRRPKVLEGPGYTYIGAYVLIEAHVFQLDPFEQLGAFSVEAASSYSYDGLASDLAGWFEGDIAAQLQRELRAKSEKLLGASWK